MAQALHTPESRFADLPGYAFAGHCGDDEGGHFLPERGDDVARAALKVL